MIELKNMCAGYSNGEVLHNINLAFQPGKVTVLVGPNGCGKSTLLKSLVRLNPHTSGEIIVDGTTIEQLDPAALARKAAYLPQNKKTPDITVLRMVLHGRFAYLKYPRRYRTEDYEIAKRAMEWVGISDLADKNVNQLSGGTQQKVYIAMALAQDTQTILMDEPTVYLDIFHQLKLMDLAKELAAQGRAVVMVLHDLAQAFETADQIVLMNEGTIQICGTVEEVYQSGMIDQVFGVHFERVKTTYGWKYFYKK